MSQSTGELTRSKLRAIRGHYRRRVHIAFLVPALVAVALGWLLFQDDDAQSGEPSQAGPGPRSAVRLPGGFDKQADIYKKAATTCK